MNILKKLAIVGALALVGLTSAQADPLVRGTYIPMDLGDPGDFDNSWTFDSAALLNAKGETGIHKGTEFVDFFQFNVPDDEYVSFSLSSGKIDFEGFNLFSGGLDGTLLDSEEATLPHSLSGGVYLLTSGVYEFDIYGLAKKTDASFEMDIFGTPAIPEPTNWALMLAGLGAMGVLARRRKQG